MGEIYAVCKTPACQQTYLIKDIVENPPNPKYVSVFCTKCNGRVVEADGMARISGRPYVIPVVGKLLLNMLYENDKLISMKLLTHERVFSWEKEQSISNFMNSIKEELKRHKKIYLTQSAIEDRIIDKDESVLFYLHGMEIKYNNGIHLIKRED